MPGSISPVVNEIAFFHTARGVAFLASSWRIRSVTRDIACTNITVRGVDGKTQPLKRVPGIFVFHSAFSGQIIILSEAKRTYFSKIR